MILDSKGVGFFQKFLVHTAIKIKKNSYEK